MGTLYTLNTHRVQQIEVAEAANSQSLDSRMEEARADAEAAVSVGPFGLLVLAVVMVGAILCSMLQPWGWW